MLTFYHIMSDAGIALGIMAIIGFIFSIIGGIIVILRTRR
jgi:hypothetical protein